MNFAKPIEQFVQPHYLEFLHGNFLRLDGEKRTSFIDSVRKALSEIEPDHIERLLRIGWREQITGSWFAGLKLWSQFANPIGKLLLQSQTCYAGQGYCFALARFSNESSIAYLTQYLDKYLALRDKEYDQLWAMSALDWVDKVNGTSRAQEYLIPDGRWDRFVMDKLEYGFWDFEKHSQLFKNVMTFCNESL